MRTWDTSITKAICLLLGFTAIGAFFIYDRQVVQPRADRFTKEFQNVPATDLRSIRFSPAAYSALISQPIDILPEHASEFLALIRDAQPYQPNHPASEWICEVTLFTRLNNFSASIAATSNNGLLIYVKGGSTLRCDPLRKLMEKVVQPKSKNA